MSACRSGCREQSHQSYAECLRAANPRVTATVNSPLQFAWDKTKQDLSAYQSARANGISPEGTSVERVREAEAASRMLGRPYDSATMPPASMITSKAAAKLVSA